VQQHILDDRVGAFAVLSDLLEIVWSITWAV
jgi:hypothetical protein